MPSRIRMQKTEPFQEGQNTNDHKKDAPKMKVTGDASRLQPSAGHDPLMQSLASGVPDLPNRYHLGSVEAVFHPTGKSYHPDQEFGKIQGATPKGTHYTPHSSPPGKNAVGSNSNRKGDNPLGRAMNKIGTNVLGKPSGGKGANPLGNNSNRTGQKSGYPAFKPKGGYRV